MKSLREYIDLVEGKSKKNKFDQSGSLVNFSNSDKYDNFTPPDDDEADDYKSGRMDKNSPRLGGYLESPKWAQYRLSQWLKDNPEFKKKD